MARKEKSPASFKDCVQERYKMDTIMNGPATILVMVLPLVILLVLFILSKFDRYSILKTYSSVYLEIVLMLELYVVMAILYQMYTRLYSHAQRDQHWRAALIRYTEDLGADSAPLHRIHAMACKKDRFPGKKVADFLLISMFVYLALLFLYYVPTWAYAGDSHDYPLAMGCGIVICILMLFDILYKVLAYPYKHEKMQNEFTVALSRSWSGVGIEIPPMIKIIHHHNIVIHIILCIVTLGLYLYFVIYKMFRNFNNHLMNQWVYENELVKVVESHGGKRFEEYMPDYHITADKSQRSVKWDNLKNFAHIKFLVRMENRMPFSLLVAELFIIFLCADYILKIVALDFEITQNYTLYHNALTSLSGLKALSTDNVMTVLMLLVDMFFLVWSIRALLGVASRRPSSWRKVVRSCVTFLIPLWLSTLTANTTGITHLFDTNVYLSTIVLAIIFTMMFVNEKIKMFYAPVSDDTIGIATWARYSVYGNLYSDDIDFSGLEDIDD